MSRDDWRVPAFDPQPAFWVAVGIAVGAVFPWWIAPPVLVMVAAFSLVDYLLIVRRRKARKR